MNEILLEKGWFIATDKENIGKKEEWWQEVREGAVSAAVPSVIQQYFPEYHGVAWYWREFEYSKEVETDRTFIEFDGVDYKADVWLNGVRLGEWESGEVPFKIDVTGVVRQKNLLCVRVVNPIEEEIDGFTLYETPHRNKVVKKQAGSNLNHGGIWCKARVTTRPAVYLDDCFVSTDIHSGEIRIITTVSSAAGESLVEGKITVFEKTCGSKPLIKEQFCTVVDKTKEIESVVRLSEFKLWDTDNPNLYVVRVNISSPHGEDELSLRTAFREFRIENGRFYLNGKKILIKSAHTGNAFPVGQMIPVHGDHMLKDMVYAKACGFNMLRSIAGCFKPEQLDFADEIGLLLYEECLASWCMTFSHWLTWRSNEEYSLLRNRRTDLKLPKDLDRSISRWEAATAGMVRRDRNHPSLVIWGLLNETKDNAIFDAAVKFLPKLRRLDDTRVVLLNSGRFDYRFDIGSASNPKSYEWENVLGNDGMVEDSLPDVWGKDKVYLDERGFVGSAPRCGDHHLYPDAPIKPQMVQYFRTLGCDSPRSVFLTEMGIGSLFNVVEEYKTFAEHGYRTDLEDASWLKYQTDRLEEDWLRLGMDKAFPFADTFLKESQRVNAEDRYRIFNILRSNPGLSGYSLTGLLDHGMCGEGLWSYWRRMKPEMFDAVSDGWSRLRFCLFATEHIYEGEELELEAVLANDGVLASGTYTAQIAVAGENGTVKKLSKEFYLSSEDFATPIIKTKFKFEGKAGKYTVQAVLDKGAPMGEKLHFFVSEKHTVHAEVQAVGLKEETVRMLKDRGVKIMPYTQGGNGVVLVGKVDESTVERLAEDAKLGKTVAFINRATFSESNALSCLDLGVDIAIENKVDWLYHKEFVTMPSTVFDGLNVGVVDSVRYGQVFPHYAFETESVADEVICAGFQTGYHVEKMSYGRYFAMVCFNSGKGRILLNTFELEDNISHPAADRILLNTVEYLSK